MNLLVVAVVVVAVVMAGWWLGNRVHDANEDIKRDLEFLLLADQFGADLDGKAERWKW